MSNGIRVVVFTSDKYLWALRPFSYLLNVYWSSLQPVLVAGYAKPDFELPENFTFHSISPINYPAQKWSNGVIEFLGSIDDDYFVLMLEDYWLRRTADCEAINSLTDYCRINHVFRLDLGTDRLFTHDPRYMEEYDTWGRIDLIQSKPDWQYHFSTQAGIFNRKMLLEFLLPDRSPWQCELERPIPDDWLVLGTRQTPLLYTQALKSSEPSQINLNRIPVEHINRMRELGYIK